MSDSELSVVEKAFLKDLKLNAIWRDIVEKLGRSAREVPSYAPKKGDIEAQSADWIFFSGVDHGRKSVLKRLLDE